MVPSRFPRKSQRWQQRVLEALMECFWVPMRLLFQLWIRFTPSYKSTLEEASDTQVGLLAD